LLLIAMLANGVWFICQAIRHSYLFVVSPKAIVV